MRRKLALATALVAVVVSVPASVYAYEVSLKKTVNIYSVQDREDGNPTVSTFDDRGNKCYVVRSGRLGDPQASISCVKQS